MVFALCLCAAPSVHAQENAIALKQASPLPVIRAVPVDGDKAARSDTVNFALRVDAACTRPQEDDALVLAVADRTLSTRLTDVGSAPLQLDVHADQLAGLQADTLCTRRRRSTDDNEPWILRGAFSIQATLICENAGNPMHQSAALAVDIAVDCATSAEDAPPETQASGATRNPLPVD